MPTVWPAGIAFWSIAICCAFSMIANDLPEVSFACAWVSGWVKLSGSIRPLLYQPLSSATICWYCGIAAANTYFLLLWSKYAPWL